jgi:hypothetical protein
MRQEVKRDDWEVFLREFGERNRRRPTRLEVIGQTRDESDYWLENGLPLSGVTLETECEGSPRVEIMLDTGTAKDSRHMTHTVCGVRRVARYLRADGFCERLEIEDGDGALTLLRL